MKICKGRTCEPGASSAADNSKMLRRSPRYESHALVEIRRAWWNPFSTYSAVLLDISWEGFKLEFISPVKAFKPGTTLDMSIPLAVFQVQAPARLRLKLIVKWFDEHSFRMGGVFLQPEEQDRHVLEKIIYRLAHTREQRSKS